MHEITNILEEADAGKRPEITDKERDSILILAGWTVNDKTDEMKDLVVTMADGKKYRIEEVGEVGPPPNVGLHVVTKKS